ncbi:MAG TPA: hypothetical protein H9845_09035 [Candidatus Agathobaculum pullicola]|nr:hypothetical protein [Candidatus Agathobaculum pullicola]
MDFSAEFIDLRNRLLQGLHPAFVSEQNTEVAGRIAALLSRFDVTSEKKLLGMMSTGTSSHAHEYRLLFAAPECNTETLADWWDYAKRAEQELVRPDAMHDYSIVSIILATQHIERDMQKKVRRLSAERQFESGKHGWSSIHFAVIDLEARKIYTNRMGAPLKNILQPILRKNT